MVILDHFNIIKPNDRAIYGSVCAPATWSGRQSTHKKTQLMSIEIDCRISINPFEKRNELSKSPIACTSEPTVFMKWVLRASQRPLNIRISISLLKIWSGLSVAKYVIRQTFHCSWLGWSSSVGTKTEIGHVGSCEHACVAPICRLLIALANYKIMCAW